MCLYTFSGVARVPLPLRNTLCNSGFVGRWIGGLVLSASVTQTIAP